MRLTPATSSIDLLSIDHVFSQSRLLSSEDFISEAKAWGYRISLVDLQALNQYGVLVPFFRADDEEISGRALDVSKHEGKFVHWASVGGLRDPQQEGQSLWWPHIRPDGAVDRWWDGYFYSPWQLLELRYALRDWDDLRAGGWLRRAELVSAAQSRRHESLSLAALSGAFLPQVLGRVSYFNGVDQDQVDVAQFSIRAEQRLAAVRFDSSKLLRVADFYLRSARGFDPMCDWWELLRHSGPSGWFKASGEVLEAIWKRIAAELFLRAHDQLVDDGILEPLPIAERSSMTRDIMLDRIGNNPSASSLERSLSKFSLSPYARVLFVVEGETEEIQLGALLSELGFLRPDRVRIFRQSTSSDWPNQVAKLVAPRISEVYGNRFAVEGSPTAIYVAMDPEGPRYGNADAVLKTRAALQRILREEVARQGGTLTQDELDTLVEVRVWGEYTYELANFTDLELERALLAVLRERGDKVTPEGVHAAIQNVRKRKIDLKYALQQLQVQDAKVALAEYLLPTLLGKLELPPEKQPPAVRTVFSVAHLAQRLTGGNFLLEEEK
ncbi:hypothetical protein [Leifsonia sp. P73]|uniref:hypothetical protein n=1 Tax=Leifsonia sp. P73 TaxID=3423959 RepID=UPI003DA2E02A